MELMKIQLFKYQKETLDKLKSGSILCGGVGSGKSLTALAYYFTRVCGGEIEPLTKMKSPKNLYIITTARKRDTLEWEKECLHFLITKDPNTSINNVKLVIDSWNNIGKYVGIQNSFFIFDEQRVIGSGAWVKAFIKITKANQWLLLSATPGDTWMDYIPVFVANGLYKNKTDFLRQHVIFNSFVRYPKVDRYVNTYKLINHRKDILVLMNYQHRTIHHNKNVLVKYDKEKYDIVTKKRWNVFEEKPIRNISEIGYIWRRIVNSDPTRIESVKKLISSKQKVIVFYNFNYELDILRSISKELKHPMAEWNGHKHEPIPKTKKWMYIVQYTSGAEGWNCIETDTVIFYSQNYSYRMMHQAAGRIDRLNTPYKDLYYYHLKSDAPIDRAISHSIANKKNFNEREWTKKLISRQ